MMKVARTPSGKPFMFSGDLNQGVVLWSSQGNKIGSISSREFESFSHHFQPNTNYDVCATRTKSDVIPDSLGWFIWILADQSVCRTSYFAGLLMEFNIIICNRVGSGFQFRLKKTASDQSNILPFKRNENPPETGGAIAA